MSESNPELDAVVARIKKLMSYANDGSASEAEYENAMGHARRLMEKFALNEAAIFTKADNTQDLFDQIKEYDAYDRANGIDIFDKRLANVACIICDVKCYSSKRSHDKQSGKMYEGRTGRYQPREFLVFYGFPKDCAVAIAMYHEMLATMRAMIRFRFPGDWQKHFQSYCTGFVERLTERARESVRVGQAESQTTTAIVLRKDVLVKRYAEEKLSLRSRKARSTRIGSSEGYSAGHSDGGRVSLGSNQIRGKQQGRLE